MAQRNGRAAMPGWWLVEISLWLTGFVVSAVSAVILPIAVLALLATDVWLGPQFLIGYAQTQGLSQDVGGNVVVSGHVTTWAQIIMWGLSLATSAVQFTLFRAAGRVKGENLGANGILCLIGAVGLVFIDTLTDIGGLMSFIHGPEVGVQIIPPDATRADWLLIFMVGTLCALGEVIVVQLLTFANSRPKR